MQRLRAARDAERAAAHDFDDLAAARRRRDERGDLCLAVRELDDVTLGALAEHAIVIAVGAFQTVQEAGGVDTLRTEASSLGSSGQTAPAATTPAPPPPAATSETAPPAAADMPSEAAPPPDATEQSDRDV